SGPVGEQQVARYMRGRLYSAALFPILLDTLSPWADKLSVPVIACGGIASAEDAMACLSLGATALQVDALLWRDPALLARIAHKLSEPLPASSASETGKSSNIAESEASET
ncbi:MAG: tRNA-dihydrouridine synthase, partial [Anaerolineae bacterium]